MSLQITIVVRQLRLPPPEKAVLLALADRADKDGNDAYPSISTLCHETGYGERTVQKALGKLQKDHRLIAMTAEADYGKRRPRTYRILLENITSETATPAPDAPVQDTHPRTRCTGAGDAPVQEVRPTPAPDAPEPVLEPVQNKNRGKVRERKADQAVGESAKRGTRMDPNFRLPLAWREWAGKRWADKTRTSGVPPPDFDSQAERFRDNHLAKGTVSKDWAASWRTWISNALTYAERDQANAARHAPAARRQPRPAPQSATGAFAEGIFGFGGSAEGPTDGSAGPTSGWHGNVRDGTVILDGTAQRID